MKNTVTLIGRVGKDPQIIEMENGAKLAKFTMATTESYVKSNGIKEEHTEWHTIAAWQKLADITERHIRKGKQICVDGSIKTRNWEDENGNTRYATEITAKNFLFL